MLFEKQAVNGLLKVISKQKIFCQSIVKSITKYPVKSMQQYIFFIDLFNIYNNFLTKQHNNMKG